MRPITRIVVHCSDSHWGSLQAITQWHMERGLTDSEGNCGYHFIILNGYPTATSLRVSDGYVADQDGQIVAGRPVEYTGAHCKGWNTGSVGICLIGKTMFSEKQIKALLNLCAEMMVEHNILWYNVQGHREYWESKDQTPPKSCPNLTMSILRDILA